MSGWGAQSFQAVWFFGSQSVDASALFEAIVGAKADVVQQQSIGVSVATGGDATTQFNCQVQPGRIDYFETPRPRLSGQFPLFEDVPSALDAFGLRVAKGCPVVGEAVRLAMLLTMFHKTETSADAIAKLAGLAGATVPFDDGLDFSFQINRRILSSGVPKVVFNRLLRWQYHSLQQVEMTETSPKIRNVDFATLTIDLNSVATVETLFQPDAQLLIWEELRTQLARISSDGSISALA
jgi:hypothetical protein